MQCVILAGGLGARMLPMTRNTPKSLIKINNIPFVDYQLSYLSSQGITDVVFCIGYLGNLIKDYVKDGLKWNLKINYIEDGDIPLGTGGALRKAFDENKLCQESFFVIYGDSFLPISYKDIMIYWTSKLTYNKPKALMAIYNNKNRLDISNASFKNGLVIYDKQNKSNYNFEYIDYGLSILNRKLIQNYIPNNMSYDLSLFFKNLSCDNQLAGYEVIDRFFEIGSVDGLKDFENYVNSKII